MIKLLVFVIMLVFTACNAPIRPVIPVVEPIVLTIEEPEVLTLTMEPVPRLSAGVIVLKTSHLATVIDMVEPGPDVELLIRRSFIGPPGILIHGYIYGVEEPMFWALTTDGPYIYFIATDIRKFRSRLWDCESCNMSMRVELEIVLDN